MSAIGRKGFPFATDTLIDSIKESYLSKKEMDRLNSLDTTINKEQMLFGINQGGIYEDIRIEHAKEIVKLDLEYIDNWSLGLDFKILFMTVYTVLARKGSK